MFQDLGKRAERPTVFNLWVLDSSKSFQKNSTSHDEFGSICWGIIWSQAPAALVAPSHTNGHQGSWSCATYLRSPDRTGTRELRAPLPGSVLHLSLYAAPLEGALRPAALPPPLPLGSGRFFPGGLRRTGSPRNRGIGSRQHRHPLARAVNQFGVGGVHPLGQALGGK